MLLCLGSDLQMVLIVSPLHYSFKMPLIHSYLISNHS